MNKILNIGLFGFGTVGQGVYQVISHATNAHAAVKRICVRDASKPRPITTPPGILTECADDILDDPGTDLIVEVVDNPAASYDIVTRALRTGA